MDLLSNTGHFHDSDAGDVYDLYNACNGEVRDGFLNVGKLNELNAEERDALDVERLHEVWLHTKTGCAECDGIVHSLNSMRVAMRTVPVAPRPAVSATDSILVREPAEVN